MFTLKSISRILSVLLIVLSLLALTFGEVGAAPLKRAESARISGALPVLRFVPDGHAAGFTSQSVYVATGSHLPHYALTIDPTLIWNTFQGGNGDDSTNAILLDGSGNIYVTGGSNASWGNPVRAYTSGRDAFVSKLDSSGALVWNTFLGGSGVDSGHGIANDSNGNIYVLGLSDATWGSPLRAHHPGSYDVFAAKLNSSGDLVWSTFLGGDSSDEGNGIAVDINGNAYVTGRSILSWGNPQRAFTVGLDEAFAARLDASGNLVWNTFLGSDSSDSGSSIAVDGNGNAYVTGQSSVDWSCLPVACTMRAYSDDWDAFVAKLDISGNLIWNSFVGGNGGEYGNKIRINQDGNIYLTGFSNATWGSPVRAYTSGWDAFVAKLNPSGGLIWNTFLGGNGSFEVGDDITVTGNGNVYIVGYSDSDWGNPVRAYGGGDDAFVAKLNASGMLIQNTFLGGIGDDHGSGIAVDGNENIYVAGDSHAVWGNPVRTYVANWDGFVAKINNNENKTLTFSSSAAQDGWVLESSENSNTGGVINSSAALSLGDDAARKQYRSILSFSTGSLPDTAVITKVTLKLGKKEVLGGGNPVAIFQGFMIDIKKGFFGTAALLQVSDFQAAASKSFGPSNPAPLKNWYSIDLTAGKDYINKLPTASGLTQIRLRFKLDDNNNAVANMLNLYSGNAPSASRPQLVITYYVP